MACFDPVVFWSILSGDGRGEGKSLEAQLERYCAFLGIGLLCDPQNSKVWCLGELRKDKNRNARKLSFHFKSLNFGLDMDDAKDLFQSVFVRDFSSM